MSIPRKKGGTAAKVLSAALSAAMVVAFTPAVALGAGHAANEAEPCGNDAASVTFNEATTYYETLGEALSYVNAQPTGPDAVATVKLLKGVTTSSEVVLETSHVVFDGGWQTLNGSAVTGKAALLVSASNVTVKNLDIVGPNSQTGTTESGGTRIWDGGEFGLKVYNASDVKISDITASHSNAGIQVNQSSVTMEGSINVSGNEWGGVELCHSGSLDVAGATLYNYDETSKTPVIWNDDTKGVLTPTSSERLYLEEYALDKDHYFLSYHHVSKPTPLDDNTLSKEVGATWSVVRCLSFTVPDVGEFTLASSGASPAVDPRADLYLDNGANGLTRIGSSDDISESDHNFQFFNLENGKTYRVYVSACSESVSGNVTVSLKSYDPNDSSSYMIAMADDNVYFDGTARSLDSIGAKVVERKSGAATDSFSLRLEREDGGAWEPAQSADSLGCPYRIVAEPKTGSGITGGNLYCEFGLINAKDIHNYWFEAGGLVTVSAASPADLSKLKIKAGRFGSEMSTLPSYAYELVGWQEAIYDPSEDWYELKEGSTVTTDKPAKPGHYAAILKGANGYSGTNEVFFTATDKTIATEPAAKTGLSYTGYSQYGLTGGSSYTVVNATGNSAYGTNAGSYSTIVKPAANCVWADGTDDARTITWSIARAKVAVPTAVAGLKYTGSGQTGVRAASNVTLGGTYYATNVGSYTATASLPNTATTSNYQWSDGTTAAKSISWSIAKGTLPVGVASVFATAYVGTAYTAPYSYAGDGAVTVSSSNPAVATATASAGVLTVTAKAAGTATVTISAAGTSNCLPATGTVVITVKKPAAAPAGSYINADGSFAGGSNGGIPGSATDAQQQAAAYKVTTPAGSGTPTVTYMGGASSGSATIPSTVKDENGVTYRVTAVAKSAHKGTKISKATLGGYVKTVGSYAFSGCTKLSSLTIGKNVSSIGTGAVKGCPKLKTITVKSPKLTKASIKNLVKGTKVTTIKCSGVSKQVIAKYLKWAKAYNKKVTVK